MRARTRRALTAFALLAAGLVGGGATLGLVPAAVLPAAGAATCTSGGGVSVVVDQRELGGGIATACAPDGGGKSATAIFASVGVSLTYAQRSPGFVCRVNGQPAADPCVNTSPADAYWGLWWSDGTKPSWTFSSSGAGSLTVPAGGSVGWAWQQDRATGGAVPPGVAPPVHQSTPTPTPAPTSSPTSGGSGSGSGGSSSATSSPSPGSGGGKDGGGKDGGGKGGGTPSSSPTPSPSSSPSASPSAPSESPLASESPSDSTSSEGAGGSSRKDRNKARAASESPSDSTASEAPDTADPDLESPSDSTDSVTSEVTEPTDQPGRVPTAVTAGALGAIALAIVGGAIVRRRRGA